MRLLVLLPPLFLLLAGLPSMEEEAASLFTWKATYAEGLSAALRRKKPLLLYFPPVDAAEEPRVIQLAPRALGLPPLAEGTRVGADEIVELLERFEVKKIPALLLLDRSENVLLRWEGKVPPNAWSGVEASARRLQKKDEEDAGVLRDGQALEGKGDLDGAYRKVLPLIESRRTAPDTLETARGIEDRYAVVARRRLIEILGRENLVPDERVLEDLAELRTRTAHAGSRKAIEEEEARLRSSTRGGRPRR